MTTVKTIGNITNSRTSEFQQAVFLNDASVAYEILDELLESGWYPQDATTEWTDIAVLDDKYYACFGEDSVMTDSEIIYIQIEPIASMKTIYKQIKTD